MPGEFKIELNKVWFYCYHGLYEEERRVGGEYVVDLAVRFISGDKKINRINETANYERLYELVKLEMMDPRDLLETVAMAIAERIRQQFPAIVEAEIRIEKKSPPLVNFSGTVAVTYSKQF